MSIDLRGQEVLGYRVMVQLGEGGMASVWKAEHPLLSKTVAIKVLDPLLARDEEITRRFIDEARIQIDLKHPNIVAIENFSTEPLAMVMELIEGRTLDEMIGREVGPIPFQAAFPLMAQILDAFGYAHGRGVIHRDIKPSNILVTPAGQVKVMDFGIAKILGGAQMTRTGTSMGTAAYMSPEQIKGAKLVDARSDIYSLGVTFYEMLAGRTPFVGDPESDSVFELWTAHATLEPPDPRTFYPAIPEKVVVAVLRALAKEPAMRFQTAEEMKRTLEEGGSGEPAPQVTAAPPTMPVGASSPASFPAAPSPSLPSRHGTPPTVLESAPGPPPKTIPVAVAKPSRGRPGRGTLFVTLGAGVAVAALVVVGVVLMIGREGDAETGPDTEVVDQDDPSYWLGKMEEPALRDEALSNLDRLYRKSVETNGQNVWAGPVRDYVKQVGGELVRIYPTLSQGGTEDQPSMNGIVLLLAKMSSSEARPVYESALQDIQGTRIVRANTAAEALARFCRSREPGAEVVPPPSKRDARWRQRCTEAAQSVDVLLAALAAIEARRAERGQEAANSPEEDQLTRSLVSALGNILLGNPQHPRRADIVQALSDILETPDTVQDLAVSVQALNMIGEIGDSRAIPVLVRALFIQGQRRKVALQEIVRPAMAKMDDLDAMANALVKAGRMQDEALNRMQRSDENFDVRLIKEQVAITLGILGVKSANVTGYLMEELTLDHPTAFDRIPGRGGIRFTPATSMAHRRSFAAQALGKLHHDPALPIITSRLRLKRSGRSYVPEDSGVEFVEIPGYIDAAGDFLEPDVTDELLMPYVLHGDDAMIDRAARRLYLQAGPEVGRRLAERVEKLSECPEHFRGRCPRDNFEQIYVPILKAAEGCDSVSCWTRRLSHDNEHMRVRAAYSLARMAYGNSGASRAARDAMIKALKGERSEDVVRAYVFAIRRISPNGCDQPCLTKLSESIEEMRGSISRSAQRRAVDGLHGVLSYRARKGR